MAIIVAAEASVFAIRTMYSNDQQYLFSKIILMVWVVYTSPRVCLMAYFVFLQDTTLLFGEIRLYIM